MRLTNTGRHRPVPLPAFVSKMNAEQAFADTDEIAVEEESKKPRKRRKRARRK